MKTFYKLEEFTVVYGDVQTEELQIRAMDCADSLCISHGLMFGEWLSTRKEDEPVCLATPMDVAQANYATILRAADGITSWSPSSSAFQSSLLLSSPGTTSIFLNLSNHFFFISLESPTAAHAPEDFILIRSGCVPLPDKLEQELRDIQVIDRPALVAMMELHSP